MTLKSLMAALAVLMLVVALAHPAEAKRHHQSRSAESAGNGSGLVVSHKTGATAHVGASHQAAFQAYIDALEERGAAIKFMGGIRRGRCWSGGLHPCGRALDVCQLSRGRVDSRCHLPNRQDIAAIAARYGLFEGGQWCSSDYGHAQVGESAAACGERTFAARRRHHSKYARAN